MAPLFRSSPFAAAIGGAGLAALDVGSRGGFDPELLPIAWAVDTVGFEPEPDAFAALSDDPGPWRSVRWIPAAVGATDGRCPLYIPRDPNGCSLLEHDPAVGRRFGLQHLTEVVCAVEVDTLTLDTAVRRFDLPAAAYWKLDVEGAELDILRGATQALNHAQAIKLEACFVPARKHQPLVCDIEPWLRQRGFELMEILTPAQWRLRPIAPHPYTSVGDPAYSRGQAGQCDLLFFRHPDAVATAHDGLRALAVALAMGHFDRAKELLDRVADLRRVLADEFAVVDADAALFALSRSVGRRVAWRTLGRRLRDMVPLVRSLLGGVPLGPGK
ncbi:FkbM family methyltransferase [Magnetospirillum aberrantis]|uniref:FkbM family methyltransferase n=1 Tax=Magnetospirillum aberrantis SpK TaxID=908842 RepID=A0A7C9UU58_9PROT|nr:FkbM family methyltransferase [Magnetospirillum aberrantis]NFV78532.1 FkbM family methyltransferase [Magnetospirillum aberrantis SpK]